MSTCTVCLRDFDFEKTASALGHDSCTAVSKLEEYARLAEEARREAEETGSKFLVDEEEAPPLQVYVENSLTTMESATLRGAVGGWLI